MHQRRQGPGGRVEWNTVCGFWGSNSWYLDYSVQRFQRTFTYIFRVVSTTIRRGKLSRRYYYFHFREGRRQVAWVGSGEQPSKPNSSDARPSPRQPTVGLLGTAGQGKVLLGNPCRRVPRFWDAAHVVSARTKRGPRWLRAAGEALEPSPRLAVGRVSPSGAEARAGPPSSGLRVPQSVCFSELPLLENTKVRTWLKNLFLSFKLPCLYDYCFPLKKLLLKMRLRSLKKLLQSAAELNDC